MVNSAGCSAKAQVGGVLDDGELRARHAAVQDDPAAVGQRLQGLQAMVSGAGTAVQAQQRRFIRRGRAHGGSRRAPAPR